MRLIDADKLYPDCMTKNGTLAISQSQIANAPTVDAVEFEYHSKLIKQAYQKGKDVVMRGEE